MPAILHCMAKVLKLNHNDTVSPILHYKRGEYLPMITDALIVTVIGMTTVFAFLSLLVGAIDLNAMILARLENTKPKPPAKTGAETPAAAIALAVALANSCRNGEHK